MGHSLAGDQWVILDRAVAARAHELLDRDSLTIQDVHEWQTDYNQLKRMAESYAGDEYIARGWREEEPRYKNVVSWLMAKVKAPVHYTPKLYNDALSLSANGSCCCGEESALGKYGAGDYTPRFSPLIPYNPQRSVLPASVGDTFRNYFGLPTVTPFQAPQIAPPMVSEGQAPIRTSHLFQYILFAALAGGILWGVWKVSKK